MSVETCRKMLDLFAKRNREAELNRRLLHSVIREKIGQEAWDDICKEYNKRLQAKRAAERMKRMYELKLVEGKLVIDLGATEDDVMVTRGYDGTPNTYDTCTIGPARVIGTVELTAEQLEVINAEYTNGGECGWCGEVRAKLRAPHMFDFAPGERMCEHCWNHDRGVYLGSYGEDIGPFDENDKSAKCTHCGEFVLEKDQYHIDDEIMFCPDCVAVHEE